MIHAFVLALGLATIPPAPTHDVTDNANALSVTTRQSLESELHDFTRMTGNRCIVWIGQSTDGQPLETWTVDAAHTWRIGRKGNDNGVVLFVFMRDHRVRIEVGYGLESVLTDARAAAIISDTIVPAMRRGETDTAISRGVAAIMTTIDPHFTPAKEDRGGANSSSADKHDTNTFTLADGILTGAFVLVLSVAIFLFTRHFGAGGRGGGGADSDADTDVDTDDATNDDCDDDDDDGDFGGGGASGSW
ncbi:MAG: TPM domain-containing protein [Vulcanimicrobiaceae bacterium]